MPLYEYKCLCGTTFTDYRPASECKEPCKCPKCGKKAGKVFTVPNLVTDTNFGYTGKVDDRLGGAPIEGRSDWKRRVAEKGYKEISVHEAKDLVDRPDRPPLNPVF